MEFVLELELLQLAALTINYADLTISMESPNFDVAIQIANEQRGMAARVGWSGTIDRVWDDPSYRQNAQPLTQAMATGFGVARVGNRVKQLYSSSQPEL